MTDTFPLLAVRGIENTTASFREQLVAGALAHGLNPNYIAAVIAFESGFNPKAMNPDGGALGLIQWRKSIFPSTAKRAGMNVSWENLPKMSAEAQLPLVFAYYADKPIGDASTASDYYLTVFLPIGVNKPLNYLLGQKGSTATHPGGLTLGTVYEKNKALDKNPADGTITVAKAAAPVLSILSAARGRAPIPVPLDRGIPYSRLSTLPSPGGVYSSPLPRPAPLPSGSEAIGSGRGARGSELEFKSENSRGSEEDDMLTIPSPSPGASDLPTLRQGDHGTAVCLLQRLLEVTSKSESDGAVVAVDGEFGYETDAALRLHQREVREKLGLSEHDFPDDGVCGPRTWASFWQPWAWSLERLGREVLQ